MSLDDSEDIVRRAAEIAATSALSIHEVISAFAAIANSGIMLPKSMTLLEDAAALVSEDEKPTVRFIRIRKSDDI